MSWFSQQWNKFTSALEDPDQPIERLEIIWNRDRLNVNLPPTPTPPTLSDLKQIISQKSGIPYEQIKLIYQGLVLKDEKAPLTAYRLQNGSRLMLVGTQGGAHGDMPGAKSSMYDVDGSNSNGPRQPSKGEELARKKKELEEDTSEAGLLARIDETVAGVRKDLVPEVDEFEKTGQGRAEARAIAAKEQRTAEEKAASEQRSKAFLDALGKRQKKLSELLLRALLTLDGIAVYTDETRKRRKDAVKEVQGYLDRVDSTWQTIKQETNNNTSSNRS